jgi:integrase
VCGLPRPARAASDRPACPPLLECLYGPALLFSAPEGGPLNLNNLRRRACGPAVKSSGIETPARIYDLRSTFASNALAAGVTVFELAKIMGTSVAMIERHYGTLIGGAHAGIAGRLDAHEAAMRASTSQQQQ